MGDMSDKSFSWGSYSRLVVRESQRKSRYGHVCQSDRLTLRLILGSQQKNGARLFWSPCVATGQESVNQGSVLPVGSLGVVIVVTTARRVITCVAARFL